MPQNTKCIYCGVADSKPEYKTTDIYKKTFELRSCRNCHSFFLAPQPHPQYLEQAYNSSYYGEGKQKFKGYIQKGINFFIDKRAEKLGSRLPKQPSILDIGCGNGHFLQRMIRLFKAKAFGIELSKESAERASKIEGINLQIGKLKTSDFDDGFFDLITLFHVFEHLDKPKETLEIASIKLKEGGFLFLSCPNINSWQSRLFKGDFFHLDPPRHLFLMPPHEIKLQLAKLGLTCVQEKYFNIKYNPFGFFQSTLNKLTSKRELLFEYLKGNTSYTKGHSKFFLKLLSLLFKLLLPILILSDLFASMFKSGATVELLFKKKST